MNYIRLQCNKLLTKLWSMLNNYTPGYRRFLFGSCCMLLAAFLALWLPAQETLAASGLKLYDYTAKKQITYKDAQVKVTYNGKKISVDSTPGILVNGIALVSYKDIFAKSAIKADCVYDNSKGTVTISKSGTTIVMKLGSMKGTVNGKAVTLPVAPVKIKFYGAGVTKVMVPSRFVCQTLGLEYTWNSSKSTVAIVKKEEKPIAKVNSLSLSYDDGSKFSYTGTLGAVTIDGEIINLGNMPSIINNNTAMLRAKRVFADSSIGADYSYDSNTKTITLSANGRVLVMTIGSTTAYLNGTGVKLDRAPMIVYNYDTKASYVMVPGNNTANCLGLDYTWNKAAMTSVITTLKNDSKPEPSDHGGDKAPELGDSGMNTTGLILNEWKASPDTSLKSTGIRSLNEAINEVRLSGQIYYVTRDQMNTGRNAETYMIVGNAPFEKVTTSQNGQQLIVTAQNFSCMDYVYQIYGSTGTYVNTIITKNYPETYRSDIEFNLLPNRYTYDISLSADQCTLYVTIYINTITGLTIGTNDQGDYLTLTGMEPLKVNVVEQIGMLSLDLPYTTNEIGDLNSVITGAKFLNQLYMAGHQEKTQAFLSITAGTRYTVIQEGNTYTILFYDSAAQPPVVENPVDPLPPVVEDPIDPSEEEETVITDVSQYEITIPRAPGITRAQITDYDDYFNNRFSIKLQGDHTGFLSQHPTTYNSNVVKDISVFLNNNNETEIRITTTKLQGYEYVMDEKNIYINIGNPKDIYPNIVILDPGHGGPANGAEYFGSKEKDFNLKILYEIGKKYFNSDPSKLKVYYTRETDVDMSRPDRAAYATKVGADLFVSLHMNAFTTATPYGTEVYYSNSNNTPNAAGLTSKRMAEIFVKNLTDGLGTSNRGAKAEKYTVVHKNKVPAVLIELGFLSNKNDHAKLSDPQFQENAARIIYETLLQIFDQYPTGR